MTEKAIVAPPTGNPQNGRGSDKTFGGQSTFIQKVEGKENAFIAMFDIWEPSNAIAGRYLWVPITIKDGHFEIHWADEWDMSFFKTKDSQDEPLILRHSAGLVCGMPDHTSR